MNRVYHGSFTSGISRLEPHKSPHGNYVYATPYKELAIIFSGRCGDDLTYSLYRNSKEDPWIIVERIPNAFKTMFNNTSSIYTLDGATFKNIHTGFAEVVSEVGVNIESEERLENVYDAIKKLEIQGKVKIYEYPNKPKEIPVDDSDLLDEEINFNKNKTNSRKVFDRLILLHPSLIESFNKKIEQLNLNIEPYKKEDLIDLFEEAVIMQTIFLSREKYLDSIVESIRELYPNLLSQINEQLLFFKKEKKEQLLILLEKISRNFSNIPQELMQQLKIKYLNDGRNFAEIGREIIEFATKINMAEQIVNKDIDSKILDKSILLIGPMGVGKSTISQALSKQLNLPIISLDNRKQLSNFYKQEQNFDNLKEFEFYLMSSVLTSLKEPAIIDFGAGHSVYENPLIFYETKKIISRFKNVELILPSKQIDESIKIIIDHLRKRGNNINQEIIDRNEHFLTFPSNYSLATHIIYTNNLKVEEIVNEIIQKSNEKNNKKN